MDFLFVEHRTSARGSDEDNHGGGKPYPGANAAVGHSPQPHLVINLKISTKKNNG